MSRLNFPLRLHWLQMSLLLLLLLLVFTSCHILTSVGLCATLCPRIGFVWSCAVVMLPTFTATLPSMLEDRFTAALLLLLADFCSTSKRFSICCAGVMWTFFFLGKLLDFNACQHLTHITLITSENFTAFIDLIWNVVLNIYTRCHDCFECVSDIYHTDYGQPY